MSGCDEEEQYNNNLDLLSLFGNIEDYESAKEVKQKIAEEYKQYLTKRYPDISEFIAKLDINTLKNMTETKIQIINDKLSNNKLFKTIVEMADVITYPSINFAIMKKGVPIAYIYDHEIKETAELSLNVSNQKLYTDLLELVDRMIDNILHDP